MFVSGWPIPLLLFRLLGSVTSSPVSTYTHAPQLPLQISPPSSHPSDLASLLPYLSIPPSIPTFSDSNSCALTISPSTLVVRFEDPVKANCSTPFLTYLGWEVSAGQMAPPPDIGNFLVWSVDSMTEWSIKVDCYTLSDGEPCQKNLPVIIYKPPDHVSISLMNHSGPMHEGQQYTLQCEVHNVAPAENLIVTFYKGQRTLLGQKRSNITEKTPVTEIFSININPSKEDDGVQYWCEAKLELGPEGPQDPPVVISQKLNATVLFGLHLICPTKLQVREGEHVTCEVRGNLQPFVTWFKDGQAVVLPTHSSRKHVGKYIVCTKGLLGQKNFTVEVEVTTGRGTSNSCNRYFLFAVLFIQLINWL